MSYVAELKEISTLIKKRLLLGQLSPIKGTCSMMGASQ